MIRFCASAAFALPLFLFANTVSAFIDPPYLTPEHPIAGDTVSINIRAGVCDGIGSAIGYPRISQESNHIRIVVWSVSYHDSGLCNLPIGTNTIAVAAYSRGSYTLQVDRDYFGFGGDRLTESLGVIAFTVGGGGASEPVAAPALEAGGFASLLLGLVGLAWWNGRRRMSY